MMLDRDQLETFAVIAEEQSFERAATILNITRSAVSQRLKALEESLSTVLLNRDKPIMPTAAGEILLRHANHVRMLEATVLQQIVPTSGRPTPVSLAIAVNADSLATWFPAAMWQLTLRRHMALEVVSDDQEHTAGRLAHGEVIGCVSTSADPASGFRAEALGQMEYRCYASPMFQREYFPRGLSLDAALAAPAILFDRKDTLHDDFLTAFFGVNITRYIRHYVPSPLALLEGIAAGAGYGLVPSQQAQHLVDEHRLVELAANHAVQVPLYWHHWEYEPEIAREITEVIVAEAARRLSPLTPDGSRVSFPEPSSATG